MKALVTGGAGFIGSHIVDLLVNKGHDVAVIDNLFGGRASNVNPLARFYEEDIRNPAFRTILAGWSFATTRYKGYIFTPGPSATLWQGRPRQGRDQTAQTDVVLEKEIGPLK